MGCLHCCGPSEDAVLLFEGRKDDANYAQDLIDTYKILIFSKLDCSLCYEAKNILRMAGVSYYAYELDMVSSAMADRVLNELHGITKTKKIPQIFINGTYVGGTCDLRELRSTHKLWEMTKVRMPCVRLKKDEHIPNYCRNRLQYYN